MNKYPLDMIHPNYIRGTAVPLGPSDSKGRRDYQGTPDRMPPVTVYNDDQEADHRARGYVASGEQPPAAGYQEYPKWLTHPDKDAVLANSAAQEALLIEQGYLMSGKPDPTAVETAEAVPYVPGQVTSEWPKLVDGVLMQDPNTPEDFQRYPMWMGDVLVNNAQEEAAELTRRGTLANEPALAQVETAEAPETVKTRGQKAWETRQRNALKG